MGNEITQPNVEGSKSSMEKGATGISTNPASNESDFLARRIGQLEAALKPQPKQEVQPETDEQPSEESDEVLSQETEGDTDTEETQESTDSGNIDLSKLNDEQIIELAKKSKSGLLKRLSELVGERNDVKRELEKFRQELAAGQKKTDPLEVKRDTPNPFKELKSVDELRAKASEIDSVIDEAEELLWANEHMAADDVIASFGGKEFTKAEIRKVLRDNQKMRKQFLPERLAQLQAAEQRKAQREANLAALKQELDWLDGEDNDVRKQYESLMASPILKQAVEKVPDLEPYLDYMVAHASNSIWNRRPVPIDDKPRTPAGSPPSAPGSSAARPEQPAARVKKSLNEAQSRFKQSGSEDDFLEYRKLKLAGR